MQIKSLLKQGRDFLASRENAVLECELVLAHVLGESKEYVFAHSDEEVEDALGDLFMKYLQRLFDGEPLAYILNAKDFYGMTFYVDKRVLLPRPETELIVDVVDDFMNNDTEKTYRVLDVGTGSANIAVSLGMCDYVSEVLALDISSDALEVARINVEQYSLESKVQLAESDLLDVVDDGEYFDVIVANLPYIGRVTNRVVSAETEKYEPEGALFGGDTGVELYQELFEQLLDKNIDFDILVGEFCFGQRDDVVAMLDDFFEDKWTIVKDLAGIDRIFIVKNYV